LVTPCTIWSIRCRWVLSHCSSCPVCSHIVRSSS
jgi:hypothetical protein